MSEFDPGAPPYIPPAGDAVTLNWTSSDLYTPPAGDDVQLKLAGEYVIGNISSTLADVAAEVTGAAFQAVTGELGSTLDSTTGFFAGETYEERRGALSAQLDDTVAQATGEYIFAMVVRLNPQLADVTATVAAEHLVAANLPAVLGDVTAQLKGQYGEDVQATLSGVLGNTAAEIAGDTVFPRRARIAGTLDATAGAIVAAHGVTGNLSAQMAGVQGSATATHIQPVETAVQAVLEDAQLIAIAHFTPSTTVTLAGQLDSVTADALAVIGVRGLVQGQLEDALLRVYRVHPSLGEPEELGLQNITATQWVRNTSALVSVADYTEWAAAREVTQRPEVALETPLVTARVASLVPSVTQTSQQPGVRLVWSQQVQSAETTPTPGAGLAGQQPGALVA